jgi:hypothetical protein
VASLCIKANLSTELEALILRTFGLGRLPHSADRPIAQLVVDPRARAAVRRLQALVELWDGQPRKADRYLAKAVKLDPRYRLVDQLLLASVEGQRGNVEDAADCAQEALAEVRLQELTGGPRAVEVLAQFMGEPTRDV